MAEFACRESEGLFSPGPLIARRQQAQSLELRAAMSLTRLSQKQDRQAEARPMLTQCYDWSTEGFDTPDLQEARALLNRFPDSADGDRVYPAADARGGGTDVDTSVSLRSNQSYAQGLAARGPWLMFR